MALLHRECEERWDRRGAMDDTRIGEWVGSGEGAIMELGQGYAGWTRVDRKKEIVSETGQHCWICAEIHNRA